MPAVLPCTSDEITPRVRELVAEQQNRNYTQTSRLFTILMLVQWAATLSPYARC
jgi:hypothetical protein